MVDLLKTAKRSWNAGTTSALDLTTNMSNQSIATDIGKELVQDYEAMMHPWPQLGAEWARDALAVKSRLHFCPLENHLMLVNLKVAMNVCMLV
eukprot:COSAG06_NODE_41094_length_395_cov_0.692568_2_plen_92_part_01